MVLVAGSDLIEDARRAPDYILSITEPMTEVRLHAKRRSYTHKDHLALSTRIHATHIGYERHIPCGCNTFQVDTEYCSYFQ
jgi:hypothetical protein